jgi:hypothetical protein
MSPKKFIAMGSIAVLVCLLAMLLLTQSRTVKALRLENNQLRQELNQMASVSVEDQGSSNGSAPVDTSQATAGDAQTELLKLRGQVALLRRQVEELQRKAQPPELTAQEQPQQSSQEGVTVLKAQLEEEQQKMESSRQNLQDLQIALDVPDEIAVLDPDTSLNKPSLKKYETYFKARQEYNQIERNRRVIYLKLVAESVDSALPPSSPSSR